ncbi:hypothetical protein F7725_024902 [Dissostichus mawsoni]|uniref:Uncharacterized protein n=1 Tax=Dissostichus mawsoni TaxID=36200 RepID=A0A7J5XBA6_DISMA|nr:hypothetical protein F7725_024902 [Dissostichus mawsoni]
MDRLACLILTMHLSPSIIQSGLTTDEVNYSISLTSRSHQGQLCQPDYSSQPALHGVENAVPLAASLGTEQASAVWSRSQAKANLACRAFDSMASFLLKHLASSLTRQVAQMSRLNLTFFTSSERLQKSLQPLHSSTHAPPVVGQSQLHPVLLVRLLVSVWILSVGTVSASPLQPALCRHENQVCPEEALQRLFLCPAAGALVCFLQD